MTGFQPPCLENDFREFLLPLSQGIEGNEIGSLGHSQNHSRILHGEEAFGHDHVQEQGEHQRSEGHQQRRSLMLQDPFHGAAVEAQ